MRTVARVAMCCLLVIAGIAVGVSAWTASRVSGQVDRVAGVFPEGDRPASSADSVTFLVVGLAPQSSSGSDVGAEMVALAHLTGDRQRVQVVSLPATLRTDASDPQGGPSLREVHVSGGPPSLVGVVESLTDVRVDHYAELDFAGFVAMTEVLGGVTVDVPDPHRNDGYSFATGPQHLEGDEALAYMRSAGAGDEGAADRQRAVLRALFDRVSEQGLLANLGRIRGLLGLLTRSLRVDAAVDDAVLTQLAWEIRGVGVLDLVTTPVRRVDTAGGRPVLHMDPDRAGRLWEYLRTDTLAEHVSEFS